MKIVPASDSSLLVVFGNAISPALHERVMALFRAFQARHDPRIRNLHPGYASLLIDFDPLRMTHDELTGIVEQLASTPDFDGRRKLRWSSPFRSATTLEFGPDLPDVAQHAGLSVEEVVRLHSSATYLVYFLGFSPGFVYLGGLPEVLHTPRLTTPRPSIVRRERGDCRRPDGNLSGRFSRRLEADWTHAAAHVRSRGHASNSPAAGRQDEICCD